MKDMFLFTFGWVSAPAEVYTTDSLVSILSESYRPTEMDILASQGLDEVYDLYSNLSDDGVELRVYYSQKSRAYFILIISRVPRTILKL